MAVRKRLGERLIDSGIVTQQQVDEALATQAITGENLGQTLISLGYLREDALIRALCEDAGVPFVSAAELRLDAALSTLIPERVARAHTAVAVAQENGRLVVAMADPFDIAAVTAVERSAGRAIKVIAADRNGLLAAVERIYERKHEAPAGLTSGRATLPDDVYVQDVDAGGSAAEIADEVLRRAVALGATDIHIEPLEDITRVRFRLDGVLQEAATYPRSVQAPLLTRLKILAGLNIAESRLPQDGRFRFASNEGEVDLRISTFPTMHGEDIVLRVLDRGRVPLDLARIGIAPDDLAVLRAAALRPHGMIAVTGPTGSGKTTTLYAALTELNTTERCILTLEDPIEYELEGTRQSQINVRAGLTFASGLRSLLRHDPDVILVGERRDAETVQIALSAALTGHLVLTTLHTNTAAGAIPRLLDMGAEPFLLASAILLVASQRLVRRLCENCREQMLAPEAAVQRFGLAPGTRVYRAVGCPACRGSGFRGRVAIFELLPITPEITAAIYEHRSAEEIERLSKRPRLLDDGVRRVLAGETSLDELLRVTS